MTRKVYISSGMAHDEALALAGERNPLYPLLWPWFLAACDDWGRAKASARELRSSIFAGNDLVTLEVIEDALQTYADLGVIQLYEVQGRRYFQVPQESWFRYQTHIRHEKRERDSSRFPPTSAEGARDCARTRDTARDCIPSPSPSPSPPPSTERNSGGGITTNRAPPREEEPSPVESSPAAAVCSALELDPTSDPGMAVAASITAHPEIDHLDQAAGWKLKNERWRRLSPTDRATRFRHWVGREVSFRAAAVTANGSRASPNGAAAPSLREFPDDLPSEPTPLELKRQWNIERANEYRDQHNN